MELRGFYESCSYWILFDVSNDVSFFLIATHPMIVRLGRPEWTGAPEDSIRSPSACAFDVHQTFS